MTRGRSDSMPRPILNHDDTENTVEKDFKDCNNNLEARAHEMDTQWQMSLSRDKSRRVIHGQSETFETSGQVLVFFFAYLASDDECRTFRGSADQI